MSGDFRNKQIYVQDHVDGEIAHTPPDAKLVEKYMEDLCEFANSENLCSPYHKSFNNSFSIRLHSPIYGWKWKNSKSIILLVFSKKEYTLIKNISISRTILNSRIQYDKAFLKTENDSNDMTYLSIIQLKVYVSLSKV